MGNTFAFGWEVQLQEWLQRTLGEGGIGVVSHLSLFGEEVVLILLIGVLYWGIDKAFGIRVGMALLVSLVWGAMIKNIVLRRRPYFDHENIHVYRVVEKGADPLNIAAQGYSFPSMHSSNAAAAFGSLALGTAPGGDAEKRGRRYPQAAVRVFGILAFLVPLLVGFSRVVVGVHYVTDVLAGWCLGGLVLFLMQSLWDKLGRNGVFLLAGVPSLLGLFYCRSEDYYSCLGLLFGLLLAVPVEERFVRFEETREIPIILLRVAGGLLVFLTLSTVLKLPFSKEFLEGGSYAALLVRAARYFVMSFSCFALYPMLFRFFPGNKVNAT